MKNDYLWDGSGEPDPEIQQLEQLFGTLRYQPQPLEIPAQLQIGRRRFPFSNYAIAAAAVLMLFAVGLWLIWHPHSAPDLTSTRMKPVVNDSRPGSPASTQADEANRSISANEYDRTSQHKASPRLIEQRHRSRIKEQMVAGNSNRHRVKTPELTPGERAEAEIAKEQLLLALRVASAKLNLAQKKAQGTYPVNLIRNQHRVG